MLTKYLNALILIALGVFSTNSKASDVWQWVHIRAGDSGWTVRSGGVDISINDDNKIFGFLIEGDRKVADIGGSKSEKHVKLTISWHDNNQQEKYEGVIHRKLIDVYDFLDGSVPNERDIFYRLSSNDVFLYLHRRTSSQSNDAYNNPLNNGRP